MFEIPIDWSKDHVFGTAGVPEMQSPGTQLMPGYVGKNPRKRLLLRPVLQMSIE